MLIPAALLAPGPTRLHNVSVLHDVWTMAGILKDLGCDIDYDPDRDPITPETLTIDATTLRTTHPPKHLIEALRASFYLFGALLGRAGEARVGMPGGDAFGSRPVNLHLEGLRAFGAEIEMADGEAIGHVPGGRLRGGSFHLEPSSVGATVNLMLAAAHAQGTVRITNAAREPDVVVFGEMLRAMGARVEGLGTSEIEIEGVERLRPVEFTNAPDRIEVGTYILAAAMAGTPGETIRVEPADADHLGAAFLEACARAGLDLQIGDGWIDVPVPETIHAVDIETAPFPGFPTDLQAQWTVFMTMADGPSKVVDPIYPGRFKHVPELVRMGARIEVDGNAARITPGPMHGAEVESADVRAGVALVLAGLIAEGTTTVRGLHHLDRGYERIEKKLIPAGAQMRRMRVPKNGTPADH